MKTCRDCVNYAKCVENCNTYHASRLTPDKDIYILNKGKYAKAPVVNVDGEKAVKMYGNVYVTKYDETRKAWLVNTKYGLYRF